MAKLLLVEDDNNLREIYEARLAAEGYEIVSAADGEAALALAIKEKPDLIISDIMMPKVSGFDMLDILRSTTETKHTKVIMMTALGQAEDKERAQKLGADLYLVKSQVTLEDVVRAAKSLLGEETPLSVGDIAIHSPDQNTENPQNATSLTAGVPGVSIPPATTEAIPVPTTEVQPASTPVSTPPALEAQPASASAPIPAQANTPSLTTVATPETPPATPVANVATTPTPTPEPVAPSPVVQAASSTVDDALTISEEESAVQKQIEQYLATDQNNNQSIPPATPAVVPPALEAQPASASAPIPAQANTPSLTTVAAPETPPPATPVANVATTPAPVPEPAVPAPTAQAAPLATQVLSPPATPAVPAPAPVPTPIPEPPANESPQPPSSFAQPPSSLQANTPDAGDPNADRPAGEQVLELSSKENSTNEPNIDASISGRKKVITPINDVLQNNTPNLVALAAKEQSMQSPTTLNAVITPASQNDEPSPPSIPTMNDIIVPTTASFQAAETQTPGQPLPPPVA